MGGQKFWRMVKAAKSRSAYFATQFLLPFLLFSGLPLLPPPPSPPSLVPVSSSSYPLALPSSHPLPRSQASQQTKGRRNGPLSQKPHERYGKKARGRKCFQGGLPPPPPRSERLRPEARLRLQLLLVRLRVGRCAVRRRLRNGGRGGLRLLLLPHRLRGRHLHGRRRRLSGRHARNPAGHRRRVRADRPAGWCLLPRRPRKLRLPRLRRRLHLRRRRLPLGYSSSSSSRRCRRLLLHHSRGTASCAARHVRSQRATGAPLLLLLQPAACGARWPARCDGRGSHGLPLMRHPHPRGCHRPRCRRGRRRVGGRRRSNAARRRCPAARGGVRRRVVRSVARRHAGSAAAEAGGGGGCGRRE